MPVVWDFGDGTSAGEGETTTHTYASAYSSPYAVRAGEPDDEGNVGEWVSADPPLVVPSRAIPWAEIRAVAGSGPEDWSSTAGHGTGQVVALGLAYLDPPQAALYDWLPEGTAKLDVQCSDPAWPRASMDWLPTPTAGQEGQRVLFAPEDYTLALQAGAPKDVQFHLIGLDGTDAEIWRKSVPFHVDLKAWPLLLPANRTDPLISHHQHGDLSDIGGMSRIYWCDAEPPLPFASNAAMDAWLAVHATDTTFPEVTWAEIDVGIPGTTPFPMQVVPGHYAATVRAGLQPPDDTTAFPVGSYPLSVKLFDAEGGDLLHEMYKPYEIPGPMIQFLDPHTAEIGGTVTFTVIVWTGGRPAQAFLDGTPAANVTAYPQGGGNDALVIDIDTTGQSVGPASLTVSVDGDLSPIEVVTFTDAVAADDAPEFDPEDYTISEVVAYAEAHPEEVKALYAAERRGKGRVTLLADLESRLA